MTSKAQSISTTPRDSRSNHRRVLRLATVGWMAMTFAAVASNMFQSRSGRPTESRSSVVPVSLFARNSNQPPPRTQSCSSASCHGSFKNDVRQEKIRADEYFVWLNDPHARAFQVLTEERSCKIFQNLGLTDAEFNPLPGQADSFVQQWRNCLGCHETNQHLATSTDSKMPLRAIAEGVSCESCHGYAEEWLHAHYQTDWSDSVTNERKQKMGFVGTYDLTARIKQCSTCHVGSDRGEVNHDLIAAGHPALRFEYVWYQSRLPKHWKPDRQAASSNTNSAAERQNKTSPTQVWLTGQLVTSITSLEQSERRLSGNGFLPTLPELSEYNCFACHHDLHGNSWRQNRGFPGLAVQPRKSPYLAIPWGNWNLGLIPILADQFGTEESKACSEAYRDFRVAIQARSPSPAEVIKKSQTTRKSLEGWLIRLDQNHSIDRLISRIGQQNPQLLISDWDQTANILLGFAASSRAENEFSEPLRQGMNFVRFPDSSQAVDSPEQFLSSENQPNLDETDWKKLLKQLSE